MRPNQAFALIILISMSIMSTSALAGDPVHLTPPLYREQARETQKTRSLSDLTTTPQPVAIAGTLIEPRSAQVNDDVVATGSF